MPAAFMPWPFARHRPAALTFILAFAVALLLPGPLTAAGETFGKRVVAGRRPRLVIVISIDQFRADYLRRFTDLFLPPRQRDGRPGGFRYLMREGSYFVDATLVYMPAVTCPGHAAILSGSYPYLNGIVANAWFDTAARAIVTCDFDPSAHVVGAAAGSDAPPKGPSRLRVTTVGDELELATAGTARVVSVALKGRAAIMLAGHAADAAIWFDSTGGRWISSTAYARDGHLPAWVEAINDEAIPARSLGTTWEPMLPPAALALTIPRPDTDPPSGKGSAFSHRLGSESSTANFERFTLFPAAVAFTLETAQRAIAAEKLGGDRIPDLLAINISTTDLVGHRFGPYSAEVADLAVRTDKLLADFLGWVAGAVPGGLGEVVVVVTGDHGVAAFPEDLADNGIPGGRVPPAAITSAAETALAAAFGGGPWVDSLQDGQPAGAFVWPNLYLSAAATMQALERGVAASHARVEQVAAAAIAKVPGVYAAYTRTEITTGAVPHTFIGRAVTRGFNPEVCGDVFVVTEPGFQASELTASSTSHGAPYAYDSQVPLLIAGPGIAAGVRPERVALVDLAPTLAALLGIAPPSGSEGRLLAGALRR